jgi:hypothetical protein
MFECSWPCLPLPPLRGVAIGAQEGDHASAGTPLPEPASPVLDATGWEQRACLACGERFEPRRSGQRQLYCSRGCRDAAAKDRRRSNGALAEQDHLELTDRAKVEVRTPPKRAHEAREDCRPFLTPTAEPEDPATTALLRPPALPCEL